MTAVRPPRPPAVRPGFGPSLPTLLRERFGVPPRTTALVGVALLLAAGVVAALLVARDDGTEVLVHRAAPAFSLVYPRDVLEAARPRPGELARLETSGASTSRVRATVTVTAAPLPPSRGSAIRAVAPTLMERRIAGLARRRPGFLLRGEGRARVNGAPGYEISYRTGPDGRRVFWRESLVAEDELARDAVLVTLAIRTSGPLGARGLGVSAAAKSAYRSLRFGTDRP